MPDYMVKYADLIYAYGGSDKKSDIENSMNKPIMASYCDDSCIRSKVEMLEKMNELGYLK